MRQYLKKAIERQKQDLASVQETVREIIERVKNEGEAGVRYYSNKFDGWDPKNFRISEDEIISAKRQFPTNRN